MVEDGEKWTVPSGHAIGLLVPKDEVVKDVVIVSAPRCKARVGASTMVAFSAGVDGCADVDLWDCQPACRAADGPHTTQLGVDIALASQYSW